MTTPEMLSALRSMVCLVDTREQDTPRARKRYKDIGIPIERKMLSVGDYSAKYTLPDGSEYIIPVAVERKMSLDELCNCFCQSRARFKREFERAKKQKIKLYLLVECATWEKAYRGQYRSRMAARSLVGSILAYLARYDCQVIFCEPSTTGNLIRDILTREGREALERMVDE